MLDPSERLDLEHLTPRSSLNRVRIVELPGIDLKPEIKGKLAGKLLSADHAEGEYGDS